MLSSLGLNRDTIADNTRSLMKLNPFGTKHLLHDLDYLLLLSRWYQYSRTPRVGVEYHTPFASSWIGRDTDGFSLLNELMRGAPALFDSTSKRQRIH